MTLGIPLEVPSVELEFLIECIVVGTEIARKHEKERDRKREEKDAKEAWSSLSYPLLLSSLFLRSLSYWPPPTFMRTRRFKHNRILLTAPDKEIVDKIT